MKDFRPLDRFMRTACKNIPLGSSELFRLKAGLTSLIDGRDLFRSVTIVGSVAEGTNTLESTGVDLLCELRNGSPNDGPADLLAAARGYFSTVSPTIDAHSFIVNSAATGRIRLIPAVSDNRQKLYVADRTKNQWIQTAGAAHSKRIRLLGPTARCIIRFFKSWFLNQNVRLTSFDIDQIAIRAYQNPSEPRHFHSGTLHFAEVAHRVVLQTLQSRKSIDSINIDYLTAHELTAVSNQLNVARRYAQNAWLSAEFPPERTDFYNAIKCYIMMLGGA